MDTDEKHAIAQDLRVVKDILEENGVFFWLMSGSLLGCIKAGTILPDDNDVDLGIWRDEMNQESLEAVIEELKLEGFEVRQRYDPAHERLKGLIRLQRDTIIIDLKQYERKDGFLVRSIQTRQSKFAQKLWIAIDALYFGRDWESNDTSKRRLLTKLVDNLPLSIRKSLLPLFSALWRSCDTEYGLVMIPAEYFEEFRTERFLGYEFNVPSNAEAFLLFDYGESWKDHDPSGPGGAEKPSHIVYSNLDIESISDEKLKIIEEYS